MKHISFFILTLTLIVLFSCRTKEKESSNKEDTVVQKLQEFDFITEKGSRYFISSYDTIENNEACYLIYEEGNKLRSSSEIGNLRVTLENDSAWFSLPSEVQQKSLLEDVLKNDLHYEGVSDYITKYYNSPNFKIKEIEYGKDSSYYYLLYTFLTADSSKGTVMLSCYEDKNIIIDCRGKCSSEEGCIEKVIPGTNKVQCSCGEDCKMIIVNLDEL